MPELQNRDQTALLTHVTEGPVGAPPTVVWQDVESIGGSLDWYGWSVGWGVRGVADALIGGPGTRLTRPDRPHLERDDVVDWWVAETVERGSLLRLRAESRLPGTAWVDIEVSPSIGDGAEPLAPGVSGSVASRLSLTTRFEPAGVAGRLYWYTSLPGHHLVFDGMRKKITRRAEARR